MAFTDNSDLFGSVHEDGINLVVRHIMRQRPSLFNYATSYFVERPELLCVKIDAAPQVRQANNPLFDVQDPIPIFGTPIPIGLNWCFQFTDLEIDFHPGNAITLPPELGTLPSQRLALRLKGCFGLDCPLEEFINELLPTIEILSTPQHGREGHLKGNSDDQPRDTIVIPTRELLCFCLELFVVAHFEWGTIGSGDRQWLKVRLDGLEIVDLKPTPMEDLIECYIKLVLRLGILPRLSTPIEAMVLNITELLRDRSISIGETITLQPAPVPAAVPNNPAIEEDQLKAFINLVVEV
ncbi:MAG: hypothetical protein M3441_11790 [Chloroflexota bacterium]|nr:hypothetical protein [Chloroflexota bacterium]